MPNVNNAYSQYMQNPKGFIVRKWISQLIQENYLPHDAIVERLANSLITEKDLEDFGKLIGVIYQSGYAKAFNDYKKHAEKLGVTLKLSTEEIQKLNE